MTITGAQPESGQLVTSMVWGENVTMPDIARRMITRNGHRGNSEKFSPGTPLTQLPAGSYPRKTDKAETGTATAEAARTLGEWRLIRCESSGRPLNRASPRRGARGPRLDYHGTLGLRGRHSRFRWLTSPGGPARAVISQPSTVSQQVGDDLVNDRAGVSMTGDGGDEGLTFDGT